jgi:hypothetical protein
MRFTSNTRRRVAQVLSAVMLVATVLPAEARIGSSSSSSVSSRSSSSSVSSSRMGGGTSMGISRPSTMASVRQAPAPSYRPVAPSRPVMAAAPSAVPAPAQAAKKGMGTGAALALGAVAGGLATYAVSSAASSHPSAAPLPQQVQSQGQYQQQPQYAPQAQYDQQGQVVAQQAQGQYQQPAPQAYPQPVPQAYQQPVQQAYQAAPIPQSSSGAGFGSFVLVLMLGAIAFVVYRKMSASKGDKKPFSSPLNSGMALQPAAPVVSQVSDETSELVAMAEKAFSNMQDMHNRGDLQGLREATTDDLFPGIEEEIKGRTEVSRTAVVRVSGAVVDQVEEQGQTVLSVRLRALVSEHPDQAPESVDEVWHFIRLSNAKDWKLAGIEQV